MAGLTFTIKEISAASGLNAEKLRLRVKKLVEAGRLPRGMMEYDYDTAKEIVLAARVRSRKMDPQRIDILKRRLIDDGLARK